MKNKKLFKFSIFNNRLVFFGESPSFDSNRNENIRVREADLKNEVQARIEKRKPIEKISQEINQKLQDYEKNTDKFTAVSKAQIEMINFYTQKEQELFQMIKNYDKSDPEFTQELRAHLSQINQSKLIHQKILQVYNQQPDKDSPEIKGSDYNPNKYAITPRLDGQLIIKSDNQEIGKVEGNFNGKWWNFYENGENLFDAGYYQEAIVAFQQALMQRSDDDQRAKTIGMQFIDYQPNQLIIESATILSLYEQKYFKALGMMDKEDYSAAKDLLLSLIEEYPNIHPTHRYPIFSKRDLGECYFYLNDKINAVKYLTEKTPWMKPTEKALFFLGKAKKL